MEIKGKIIKVLPLQSGEGRNGAWKRQEYILEYGEKYPKILCFSLRGDRIDQFPVNIDEEVTVSFDVESREYNGRYYTDVKAWKIEKGGEASQGEYRNSAPAQEFGKPADLSNREDKDDLPF